MESDFFLHRASFHSYLTYFWDGERIELEDFTNLLSLCLQTQCCFIKIFQIIFLYSILERHCWLTYNLKIEEASLCLLSDYLFKKNLERDWLCWNLNFDRFVILRNWNSMAYFKSFRFNLYGSFILNRLKDQCLGSPQLSPNFLSLST